MILPPIPDPSKAKPGTVEVFDKKRRRVKVDLNEPFFKQVNVSYPACNHRSRGVVLRMETRTVECKCGVQMDAFDALLVYAHSERRLQNASDAIAAHEAKEAEKKAKKPFVRRVTGFAARYNKRKRVIGYDVRLECGHARIWDRRRPPRNVTCDHCFRDHQLTEKGVAVPRTFGTKAQKTEDRRQEQK